MDHAIDEQAVRREAVRRRLAGETRSEICQALERSTSWFDKWWSRYQQDPTIDFAEEPRAPYTVPQRTAGDIVTTIVSLRHILEAGRTRDTRYGLIGAGAIQGRLIDLKVKPVPSLRTIQRVLEQHDLTHPVGAGQSTAYYPWPIAWAVNAIQATDIITRHVFGGETIENFHTLDHYRLCGLDESTGESNEPHHARTPAENLGKTGFAGGAAIRQ